MPKKTVALFAGYQTLFDSCLIKPGRYVVVDTVVNKILQNKSRYEAVAKTTGVPWYFIAIVHILESGGRFNTHLHNGDPLSARTKQVPKGRPKAGEPPFTWEESAEDALRMKKLDKVEEWSVPELLYRLEGYNGFGYRSRGIESPYLWSFSNHYIKGKYVADGKYDANAVSKQVGAAVILRRLAEKQQAIVGEYDRLSLIRDLMSKVKYSLKQFNSDAKQLQILLNAAGVPLKADGFAGPITSDAAFLVTGKRLKGDPRTKK